ncbi:D-alanyl-D-alanine carboxypeptidase family protein [Hydrogenobaculum acidophilum]
MKSIDNSIKWKKFKRRLALIGVLVILFLVVFWLLKPSDKPKIVLTIKNISIPGKLNLEIPKNDKIYAIGTVNDGILIKHHANKEWPLASLTKIMTAYVVLKAHPLKEGENGPKVKITRDDVLEYKRFKNEGQSVAKVFNGESLSERKLLEGMLIPSANNFSYIIAKWDSGNVKTFVKEMNETAYSLNLKSTHYVGPAGAKPGNISNALDQFILAKKVMKIKTFRHIVAMPQTFIPKEGVVYNVNYDLGADGIQGIKTGTSSRALGNFIFYAVKHNIHILGVLLGVNGRSPLMDALKDAKYIVKQLFGELFKEDVVKKGEKIGFLRIGDKQVKLIATKTLVMTGYPGLKIRFSISVCKHIKLPMKAYKKIGYLEVALNNVKKRIPVEVLNNINSPSIVDKIRSIYKLINI